VRTLSVLTVLILAGLIFVFAATPVWRRSTEGLAIFIVIVAIIAIGGASAAIVAGKRQRPHG
jgi:hypothetical protein